MQKLLILFILILLPVISFADEAITIKKINALKVYIREHHQGDFDKVKAWAADDFQSDKPVISPSVLRSYYHFERLYKDYLDEHVFQTKQKEAKLRSTYNWYKSVNDHLRSRKISRFDLEPFAFAQILSFGSKVQVSSPTGSSEQTLTTRGLSLGAGLNIPNEDWFFRGSGEVFVTNGDVTSNNPSYQQKSAVLAGFIVKPAYGYNLTSRLSFAFGVPMMFKTLRAKKINEAQAKIKSHFSIGPEISSQYRVGTSVFLNAAVFYLDANPAFSIGAGFFFK